jgi:hypothetical protein
MAHITWLDTPLSARSSKPSAMRTMESCVGKTALVNIEIETGSEILQALDDADLKVHVALWVQLPDYEDRRLLLASRAFDNLPPFEAYGLVNSTLRAANIQVERTPPILILPMTSAFIRGLRKIFGKTKSVEGMRLGGQTIGDRFIEDAYVYRIG